MTVDGVAFPSRWDLIESPDQDPLTVVVPRNTVADRRANEYEAAHGDLPETIAAELLSAPIPSYLRLTGDTSGRVCLKVRVADGSDAPGLLIHPVYRRRLGGTAVVVAASAFRYRSFRLFRTAPGRLAVGAFVLALAAAWIGTAFAIGKAQADPWVALSSGWAAGWQFVGGAAAALAAILVFVRTWFASDASTTS